VITVVEKQSGIGRDVQLAMLQQQKWQTEIDKAVDKVKMGVIPGRKRTKNNKWFRRNWYRTMMRDRKRRCVDGKPARNRMKKKIPFY
jgi:hypothetical protein